MPQKPFDNMCLILSFMVTARPKCFPVNPARRSLTLAVAENLQRVAEQVWHCPEESKQNYAHWKEAGTKMRLSSKQRHLILAPFMPHRAKSSCLSICSYLWLPRTLYLPYSFCLKGMGMLFASFMQNFWVSKCYPCEESQPQVSKLPTVNTELVKTGAGTE